jgi:hypothetical protein
VSVSKLFAAPVIAEARRQDANPRFTPEPNVRVICYLADENERLRVRNERLELACDTFEQASAISLADATKAEEETRTLRASLAECVAPIEDGPHHSDDECGSGSEECDAGDPCWRHRRRALLAKLGGTTR